MYAGASFAYGAGASVKPVGKHTTMVVGAGKHWILKILGGIYI